MSDRNRNPPRAVSRTQGGIPLRPQAGYTRLPNLLIDQIMPALSDTEWRLLVVIARQTLGRIDNQSGTDWLSHSQLKTRTGRASAAISRALDGLVSSGLVVAIAGEGGRELASAESRRAHHGRCLYGLSAELLRACGIQRSETHPVNAGDRAASAAETSAETSNAQFSLSGIRKAKTTKEITYKRENTKKEANAPRIEAPDDAKTTRCSFSAKSPSTAPPVSAVRIHSGWQRAGDIAAHNARVPAHVKRADYA